MNVCCLVLCVCVVCGVGDVWWCVCDVWWCLCDVWWLCECPCDVWCVYVCSVVVCLSLRCVMICVSV